jgi:hypothetical protein
MRSLPRPGSFWFSELPRNLLIQNLAHGVGDSAGFVRFAFFDGRFAAMSRSVRNEAARRQGEDEHRLQTGATRNHRRDAGATWCHILNPEPRIPNPADSSPRSLPPKNR